MLESFYLVDASYPWLFRSLAFVFGACWGSFANVAIYRWPREMSVARPASHCFSCGQPIRWYDNLPVLGWVLLRGKARCCGAPFSPRYALVELLTGLLFLAVWWQLPPPVALVGFVFVTLLVIGTFIDWDTQELPDAVTVLGAGLGLLLSPVVPAMHGFGEATPMAAAWQGLLAGVMGLTIGSGVILWIAMFASSILRKDAMGFGDVLLMGFIGAFCGWRGALFAIFGGALIGAVVTLVLVIINRLTGWQLTPGKVEDTRSPKSDGAPPPGSAASPKVSQSADTSEGTSITEGVEEVPHSEESVATLGIGAAIPFGPWLAAGGLLYFVWMREPVDAYFAEFAEILAYFAGNS